MLKRLTRHTAVQALLARLLALYLHLALRSTRWRFVGIDHLPAGEPAIIAFWHERLPLMPMMWRLSCLHGVPGQAHVLVSRHRDGRLIGDVLGYFNARVVHGSTESGGAAGGKGRGGASGLRRLLRVLADGDYVVITPDGPRGPRRQAVPGVAQLAALSGAKVLPAGAQIARRITLNSWDRMVLPLPFSRGVIVCGPPIFVARGETEAGLAQITAALTAVADQADAQCQA